MEVHCKGSLGLENVKHNLRINKLAHELSHNAGTKDKFQLIGVNEVYINSDLCTQWSKKFGNNLLSNEDFAAYCIGNFLSLFYQSDF